MDFSSFSTVTELDVSNITINYVVGKLTHVRIVERDECYVGVVGYTDIDSTDIRWALYDSSCNPLFIAARLAIHIWMNSIYVLNPIKHNVYNHNKESIINERSKDVW